MATDDKAVPIAEDLVTEHRIFSTGKNVRPTAQSYVELIERVSKAEQEKAKLKADLASSEESREAVEAKFEGCPHSFGGDYAFMCGCSYDNKSHVCAVHAPQLKKALEECADLRAQVAALSAPVSDEEWAQELVCYETELGAEYTSRAWVNQFIAARLAKAQTGGSDGSA